jgi:hypothetical protein
LINWSKNPCKKTPSFVQYPFPAGVPKKRSSYSAGIRSGKITYASLHKIN